METPRPPNRAQLCGCRIAFLERGPAAQRMEHLDWNCFLNRFFLCVYFSHILTFLKTPWPKAIKTLYYSAEIRGPVSAERPRWVSPGNQGEAEDHSIAAEGKFSSPRPHANHWGSRKRRFTKE